jgi:transcriptional regulator with XRE-family HTH domain
MSNQVGETQMQFGFKVRTLRAQQGLTQRALADRLGVSISYISKVENEKLHFGDYPSEKFIHKLAAELDADEDELLLLADKVPDALRQRIRERPDVFNAVADLDNESMDQLLQQIVRKLKRVRTS